MKCCAPSIIRGGPQTASVRFHNGANSGVTDPDFGLITSTNPGNRLIAERYFRLGLKLLF
jgi:hypothetical protein